MLQECRRSLGNNPSVVFVQIDGFRLSTIPTDSIDIVYSHDVFVHFSSLQVYTYLLEIKRVLKHDGLAIISFYNFETHFHLFKEMAIHFASVNQFPPHMRVHFLTQGMLQKMCCDVGLKIAHTDTTNFLIAVLEKSGGEIH